MPGIKWGLKEDRDYLAWKRLLPKQKEVLTTEAAAYLQNNEYSSEMGELGLETLYAAIFKVLNIEEPKNDAPLMCAHTKLVDFMGVRQGAEAKELATKKRLPHINDMPAELLTRFGACDQAGELLTPPTTASPIAEKYNSIISLRDAALASAQSRTHQHSR